MTVLRWQSGLLLAGLLFAVSAQAQLVRYEPHRSIYGVFTAGFTDGGDELASVEFRHGGDDDVDAGGQILLGGGIIVEPRDSILQYQFTANYHVDGAVARDGEAEFERFPLEALMFFRQGNHRFGFGLSYHLSPEFDIEVDGVGDATVNFDDALGVTVEYNYRLSRMFWLGLRYTDIDYEVEEDSSIEIDGNHVGLMMHIQF